MEIEVQKEGATPAAVVRAFNKGDAQREAFLAIGKDWHKESMPEHFTHRGATRYGYRERRIRYQQSKQNKYGHRRPLEYSGATKERARLCDVRATRSGARVVLHTPVLNFRPRGWPYTMREEMTRITEEELERLGLVGGMAAVDACVREGRPELIKFK